MIRDFAKRNTPRSLVTSLNSEKPPTDLRRPRRPAIADHARWGVLTLSSLGQSNTRVGNLSGWESKSREKSESGAPGRTPNVTLQRQQLKGCMLSNCPSGARLDT
ncbi:hypothetical protein VTI28DRAFT_9414 [Corynascus sepedonium]